MFNLTNKQTFAAVCVGVVCVSVATSVWLWSTRKKWSDAKADGIFDDLTECFNDATAQYPNDRNKAITYYELTAQTMRDLFVTEYSQFEECAAWVTKFDALVKVQKASLRKG